MILLFYSKEDPVQHTWAVTVAVCDENTYAF